MDEAVMGTPLDGVSDLSDARSVDYALKKVAARQVNYAPVFPPVTRTDHYGAAIALGDVDRFQVYSVEKDYALHWRSGFATLRF
jgi:hypothetical protein